MKRPPTTLYLFFVEVYVSIKLVSCVFEGILLLLFLFCLFGDCNESLVSLIILFFWIWGLLSSFVLSIGIGISAKDFTSYKINYILFFKELY